MLEKDDSRKQTASDIAQRFYELWKIFQIPKMCRLYDNKSALCFNVKFIKISRIQYHTKTSCANLKFI